MFRFRDKSIIFYLITLYAVFSMAILIVNSIDCFKCVSMNWDNPACDDPFHNNNTFDILESPCMGGRKGRNGLFPATSCIKIAGTFDDTDEHITVRGCALDSGTLTTDTEIVRMSHCGGLYYDDRYVHGCLQSCNDADACNDSPLSLHSMGEVLIIGLITQYAIYRYVF
ncbi:uncharacterized protein LOC123298489 [Chrysoperla carnea]|uniref:uncharacterized protein LOC123298489 n=1 Tax=Chrysoperla carnea TaxID=189513 RepID=UPI001D083736|nr:uncharacterized protein LOC123298489 [Chrysoperla carnea]